MVAACCSRENVSHLSPIGLEPLSEVSLFENHYETYLHWLRTNQHERIVLHFDTHVDLDWMREKDLQSLLQAPTPEMARKFVQSPFGYYIPEQKVMHVGNWLYAAYKKNMIRQLVWVVPDSVLLDQDWLEKFQTGLRLHQRNITEDEIKSFQINDHTIAGQLYGLPITICRLGDVPSFSEPILLDIDIDYFSFDSAIWLNRLQEPRRWPEDLIRTLREKNLKTDQVTISSSVQGGYTALPYKWLGEDLRYRLLAGSKLSPDSLAFFSLLREGHHLVAQGEFEKSLAVFEQAHRLKPDQAAVLFGLGMAEGFAGRDDRANEHLRQAAALGQGYRDVLLYKAEELYYDKHFAKASEWYRRIDKASPQAAAHIQRNYAGAQQSLGNNPAAISAYQFALKINPNDVHSLRRLGDCYLAENQTGQAAMSYQQGLQFDPDSPDLHERLGKYALERGDGENATTHFQAAIRVMPNAAAPHYYLAAAYKRMRYDEEATATLQKAETIDASFPAQLGNMAVMAMRNGKAKDAVGQLEILTLLYPEDATAWYNLAAANLLLNQPQPALAAIKKCIQFGGRSYVKKIAQDEAFAVLHKSPEYQRIVK
jgi:tetratricopeptide (TPR) repeat protein